MRTLTKTRFGLKRSAQGFTLLELVIVTSIIGILASAAYPKYADSVRRSREAKLHSLLGNLRSAINLYYSDKDGVMPTRMIEGLSVDNNYFGPIPLVNIPAVAQTGNPGHLGASGEKNQPFADDDVASGVWLYYDGDLRINCTHRDTKNNTWSTL